MAYNNSTGLDLSDGTNNGGGLSAGIVFGAIGGVIVLVTVIAIIGFWNSRRNNPTQPSSNINLLNAARPPRRKGLERSVIESFPVFTWNSSNSQSELDLESQVIKGVELEDERRVESQLPLGGVNAEALELELFQIKKEEEEEKKRQTLIKKLSSKTLNTEFKIDVDDAKETCAVCSEDFQKNDVMRVLPCGHRYHLVCVDTWLELATFCPLCRKDFGTKEEPAASSSSASPELLTTPDLPKAPEQAHTPESPTSHSRDQRERRVDTSN